jgi:hypothetical protein
MGFVVASQFLGEHPDPARIGPGFPIAFAGAALAALVGAWIAAPVLGARRGPSLVAALAVASALLLAAGAVSTWSSSTRTSPSGEVRRIRSSTLLKTTSYDDATEWLGDNPDDDPEPAVWAGRVAFAGSVATATCAVLVAVIVLRRRSRPARPGWFDGVARVGLLSGAVVVLAASGWFIVYVPRLSPSPMFLDRGAVFTVCGALLSAVVAMWSRAFLARGGLPDATATDGDPRTRVLTTSLVVTVALAGTAWLRPADPLGTIPSGSEMTNGIAAQASGPAKRAGAVAVLVTDVSP